MPYEITTHREQKPRSGVAFGGLGCGWFELRQDGTFANWNIFNNRPLGCAKPFPLNPETVLFFLIRYHEEGKNPRLVLLQIESSHNAAGISSEFQYIFPWLNGVDRIRYSATFPFVKLDFSERDLPLEISLEAWSPFIPRDIKNSSLPVAFFDFSIRSTSDKPADVSILATFRNVVAYDVEARHYTSRVVEGQGYRAFESGVEHVSPLHPTYGTMGVASMDTDSHYYLGWEHVHPYYERILQERVLPDHDDTAGRNKIDSQTGKALCLDRCFSTIGRTVRLDESKREFTHSFSVAWHFPNNYAKLPGEKDGGPAGYLEDINFPGNTESGPEQPSGSQVVERHIEGHYYSNCLDSSSAVMAYAVENRASLLAETRRFHDAFYSSTIELEVLDQINSQLNTFRTSSWLTRAGDFGIIEGLTPTKKFAGLATTDVAMYGAVATASLFPELDRAVTRAHARLQNEDGSVVHSIDLNFRQKNLREASGKRIDMPAQFAYMALRAYFWSGDREYLEEIWPSVQRALHYVLRERDANGDLLPDITGVMCSYDNFPMYGVAPYIATQWLAAVSSAAEAAAILGDAEAEKCWRDVLTKGAARMEETTWNGSYYRLYSDLDGPHGDQDEGVLTDQLLGEWAVHLVDLPNLLPQDHVQSALQQIMKFNFHASQGLRNCQWPGDGFLHPVAEDCWVDQANTCWSGVELAFASFLIYEGMVEEGLRIIRQVDARYRRWGIYWDHKEFGGHYFRPMSAWSIVPALLGHKVRDGVITFQPRLPRSELRMLFTTAHGYGHYVRGKGEIRLEILSGELRARELRFALDASIPLPVHLRINGQLPQDLIQTRQGPLLRVTPSKEFRLAAGDVLTISPNA